MDAPETTRPADHEQDRCEVTGVLGSRCSRAADVLLIAFTAGLPNLCACNRHAYSLLLSGQYGHAGSVHDGSVPWTLIP